MKNLFPALLAMAFLLAAGACSRPADPTGPVTNNTFLNGIPDLDGDGVVDENGYGGTLQQLISETCAAAPEGGEAQCVEHYTAALRAVGDCDFDRTDDPEQCPRVGILDCTNPMYTVCAPCISPLSEEVVDGVDNNCDGNLAPGECGDVSDCTGGTACNSAVCGADHLCASEAVVCDDNETCTTDSCDAALGCVFTPTQGCCTTDENCGDDEVCTAGSCEPVPCQDDDLTDCLAPVAMNHQCLVQNVANGSACNDGNACSTGETCTDGVCSDGVTPSCDDANACTTDSCDLATGCAHTALSCDDGEACTTDSCNPALGCVYTPTQGCCTTDANCAGDEYCTDAGSCEPVPCTDSDLTDCVAPTPVNHACVVVNVPNGTSCLDANACTTGQTCTAGVCGSGTVLSCNDNNACTTDSCNPLLGCAHAPVTCNDNNACTTDSCSPATGCGFAPILGCEAACNPRNDRLGEDTGDCAPYRPTLVNLPAHYGWGCIPTGLVFEPLLSETGTCGPYEDADNDEVADEPEQICNDAIDGDLNGVVNDGPVCQPTCANAAGCNDNNPCTTDTCTDGVCVNSQIVDCCTSNEDCSAGEMCNDAEVGMCVLLPVGDGITMTWTRKDSTPWNAFGINPGTCTDRIGTIAVTPDGKKVTVTFTQDPDGCRMNYKLDNGAGGTIFDPGCWGSGGSIPSANNPDNNGDGIGDACAPQFLGTVSLNCNGVAREVGYSPNLIGNGVDYRPDCTPLPIPAP